MGITQRLGTIPLAIQTDASNNIGIGAAPSGSYKLEVTGTGRYYANTTSIGNATGLKIEQAGTGDAVVSYLITGTREWLVGVDNSDGDTFKINNITGSADFTNIGLSLTTSGAATLNNSFTTSGTPISFLSPNLGTNQTLFLEIGKNFADTYNSGEMSFKYVASGSSSNMVSLGFYGAGNKLNVLGNGNVGIGTSSADQRLTVLQSTEAWASSFSNSNGVESVDVYLSYGSGHGMAIDSTENDSKYLFKAAAGTGGGTGKGSVPVFTALCNGNVGINTSSPSAKLEVNGNIFYSTYSRVSTDGYFGVGNSISGAFSQYDYLFLNNTAALGGLFCVTKNSGGSMGGVYLYNAGTSWIAYSDERLKNIKEEITGAVDILKQIRAVKYTWKSDTTETLNVGVIAQDIQKVLPEIIDVRNDEMKTLGVRHTELIPVLIAAIQELNERLNKAGL
jgi:hypothetical protein